MPKIQHLLFVVVLISGCSTCTGAFAQTVTGSINSGAISSGNFSHTIGEILVLPDTSNQNQCGILGIVSSLGLQTVGLAQVAADDVIYIYPNPVARELHFNMPVKLLNAPVCIYSASGKFIEAKKVEGNHIDVADLSPGIFILSITDHNGCINFKIIKQ